MRPSHFIAYVVMGALLYSLSDHYVPGVLQLMLKVQRTLAKFTEKRESPVPVPHP